MSRFTTQQYQDIQRWLAAHGVKDTDFDSVTSVTESDFVVIVQNGVNVKIPVEVLIDKSARFKGLLEQDEILALTGSETGDYAYNLDTGTIWHYEPDDPTASSNGWVDSGRTIPTELPDNLLTSEDIQIVRTATTNTVRVLETSGNTVDLNFNAANSTTAGLMTADQFTGLNRGLSNGVGPGFHYGQFTTSQGISSINITTSASTSSSVGTASIALQPVTDSQAGIVTPDQKIQWDSTITETITDVAASYEDDQVILTFFVGGGGSSDGELTLSISETTDDTITISLDATTGYTVTSGSVVNTVTGVIINMDGGAGTLGPGNIVYTTTDLTLVYT